MVKARVACAFLRLRGWAFEGDLPKSRKYVLIAAPHTSNWDFVYMAAMALALGVRLNWLGKLSLFTPPLGWLLKAMGGIPIRRDQRSNAVEQGAARFADREEFVLAIPAEGTRRRSETWRSGFYHVARLADVPIALGYLDYARKRGGVGPEIRPSGDVVADMDRIRSFYADKVGRYPEQFTPPRLAEEAAAGPRAPDR
jgi:1-acyl-sn-glycerol-3-phosphate acyltransferase